MTHFFLAATAPCGEADFDIAATASEYSKLAGLLAGFAFTALILVVTRHLADREITPIAHVAESLLAAFAALILTSVNYALLAGEREAGPRAAAGEVFAGLGFVMAGVLLLYAVVTTLEGADAAGEPGRGGHPLADAAESLRGTVAVFFAPLFLLLLHLGSADYRTARPGEEGALEVFGWILVGIQVLVSATIAGLRWKRRRDRAPVGRSSHDTHFLRRFAQAGVLVVVLATAALQLTSTTEQCPAIGPGWIVLALGTGLAVTGMTSAVFGGLVGRR